jgi:general secretion pathway protein M
MTEPWLAWWSARSPREQRLLAVMAGLIALILLWLLVVRPLAAALDEAKTRHAAAVASLAQARARSPAAVAAGPDRPALPVAASLRRSAAEAGFAAARVESAGAGRVSFAIDAARPPALFAWIAEIERSGIRVETLQARRNPDRTVRVQARFGPSR